MTRERVSALITPPIKPLKVGVRIAPPAARM
jgi:hypothetical protein